MQNLDNNLRQTVRLKDVKISMWKDHYSPEHMEIPLSEALQIVKNNANFVKVDTIRQYTRAGLIAETKATKAKLSCFTFGGTFTERKNEGLQQASGLICLDLDKLGERLAEVKAAVIQDPHTVFAFISPSGTGLKFGFYVPSITDDASNKEAFGVIETYLLTNYGVQIDKACKDIARLCYESYDADCYINYKAHPFTLAPVQAKPRIEAPPTQKPAPKSNGVPDKWLEKTAPRKLAALEKILSDAPRGERHYARLRAAKLAGGLVAGGLITDSEAWAVLKQASDAIADGGRTSASEAKTLTDAYDKGLSEPIYAEREYAEYLEYLERTGFGALRSTKLSRTETPNDGKKIVQYVDENTGELLNITDEDVFKAVRDGEAGQAMLLSKIFSDRLYDHINAEWLLFRRGVWSSDGLNSTGVLVLETLKSVLTLYRNSIGTRIKEAKNGTPSAFSDGENDTEPAPQRLTSDEKHLRAINNELRKINSRSRIKNIEAFLREFLPVRVTDFDSDLNLLNCENGVLNLQTGEFSHHASHQRHKRRAGTNYEAGAIAPVFLEFLQTTFGENDELIKYLQMRFGLCLSGERGIQDVLFAYGLGANGKSLLFAALRLVFGSYFISFPISTLLAYNRTNTNEYHLVRLQGARLAVTSEIPQGSMLNEVALKDLTGGEEVVARNPMGRPFTFAPTHQTVMVGNAKPRVRASDEGTWRRLSVVPFLHTVPPENRKPMPAMLRMFSEERAGILNWLVDGYNAAKDYEREGKPLPIPETIKAESKAYREENDVLSEFLRDNIEKKTAKKALLKDLFALYQYHCHTTGENPALNRASQLGEELERRGFIKKIGGGNLTEIHGLQIISQKS